MPNWCDNILKVEGPAKEIARFKKKARGRGPHNKPKDPVQPLSLHALVPQPKKYNKGDAWYNWRIANWGTKWDVDSRIISEEKTCIEYGFESAWAPPMEWLATVGPMFPELSFRLWYAEGGCDFGGVYTVQGDEASNDEKTYLEAQLDEHGVYNATCEHCDNDVEITSKEDARVCEECLKHRCVNCERMDTAHIDGKCPFDSTTFKNLFTEKTA